MVFERLKDIILDQLDVDDAKALFSEELGAVIQVTEEEKEKVLNIFAGHGLGTHTYVIGKLSSDDHITFTREGNPVLSDTRVHFRTVWAETTYHMQSLRDNPKCAKSEFDAKFDAADPGLNVKLTFDLNEDITAPFVNVGVAPKIAILREQGVNSQNEIPETLKCSAALTRAENRLHGRFSDFGNTAETKTDRALRCCKIRIGFVNIRSHNFNAGSSDFADIFSHHFFFSSNLA